MCYANYVSDGCVHSIPILSCKKAASNGKKSNSEVSYREDFFFQRFDFFLKR